MTTVTIQALNDQLGVFNADPAGSGLAPRLDQPITGGPRHMEF